MTKLGIYLPEEVHVALRHAAIDQRTSATALVRRLIEDYLGKWGKKGGK